MMSINKIKHIHMIAICGTAMGSLAAMLKSKGYKITGSDANVYPPMSTFLEEQGIPIFNGFSEENLNPNPDLVIIGNAMSRGNPEVEYVLANKIPYTSSAAALKEFFIAGKHSIVVSGTHGKTTTSSLLAWTMEKNHKKPGFMIGGIPLNFNQGFKIDEGDIFIVEGDEYDTAFFDKAAKFFHYMPDTLIVNNIEFDHADIYNDLDQIILAFRRLVNLVPGNGLFLACNDDSHVRDLTQYAFSKVETFGLAPGSIWRADNIIYNSNETIFDVLYHGQHFANFKIPLSGDHSVRNALATIGTSHFHGISPHGIQDAFSTFKSVKKRLEVKAIIKDIIIYDDFAHHPTEVNTTINGLRNQYPDRHIWAIFEPRTSTAKRKMMEKLYTNAFDAADSVIFAPIHLPKKVNKDELMSVQHVVEQLKSRNKNAHHFDTVNDIVDYTVSHVKPGDLILIMSNGAFNGIHNSIIDNLTVKYDDEK